MKEVLKIKNFIVYDRNIGVQVLKVCLFLITLSMIFFSTSIYINNNMFKNIVRIMLLIPVLFTFVIYNRSVMISKNILKYLIISIFQLFAFIFPSKILFNLLLIFLLVIVVNLIGIKESLKIILLAMLFGLMIILIFVKTNILPNYLYIDQLGRYRYNMGFANPNYFSLCLYCISVIFFLIKNKYKILISSIPITLILFISNSRTPLIAYVVLILVYLFTYLFNKYSFKFGKTIIIFTILSIFIIGILMPIFSKSFINIYPKLDSFFSNRLILWTNFVESSTIYNLFFGGANIKVDSSYLNILYGYGIIFVIIFIINTIKITINLYNMRKYDYLALLTSLLTYGITENILILPTIPITIIFWSILINDKSIIEE
jgi:hypothetical protein